MLMSDRTPMMTMTPTVAIHTTLALSAVALGPWALWARMGARVRPRLHRAAGYAWVTCLVGAALSALFIPSTLALSLMGLGPIHLLIGVTLLTLAYSFSSLANGRIEAHRRSMQMLYLGACVVTGAFTLLPGRALGQMVWGRWLGWL